MEVRISSIRQEINILKGRQSILVVIAQGKAWGFEGNL
jgi:hypothetical protein